MQVSLGVLFLSLNVMRDCRLHREEYKRSANIINYLGMGGCVLVTAINLLASGLDPGLASLGTGAHPSPDIPALGDSLAALASDPLVANASSSALTSTLVPN